ncbi:uncharacterized protein TNCV_3955111 [Trichonephila clavipes]|nr:uncharacterized protein TNCV_3955111 [Trichonephila clavipes]
MGWCRWLPSGQGHELVTCIIFLSRRGFESSMPLNIYPVDGLIKTDCLRALWAGGILLQNDEGHNVTVNGDRYRALIITFFIPELNNHDVQELWFQQDGATCHTARSTIDLLKDTLGDRLNSRFGPVNWPPRSCDLTPLDYFLWELCKVIGLCG